MSTWDMITTYPQVSFWLGSVMCETWHFRQSQTVHSPLTRKTIFMDLILSPYPYHISWTITHVPFANLDYQVENSQFFPSPNLWTNKRNQYPNKMRISLLQSPFLLVELPFVSFLSPTKKNNASNPKYMNLRIKHQTSWKQIVFFFSPFVSPKETSKSVPWFLSMAIPMSTPSTPWPFRGPDATRCPQHWATPRRFGAAAQAAPAGNSCHLGTFLRNWRIVGEWVRSQFSWIIPWCKSTPHY